ncbi:MAG: peptidase U32 family protein [Verrucomicrobiota bacterium]|nr:peptidase U32 family protein [Verrucomicrobiota bacterium]
MKGKSIEVMAPAGSHASLQAAMDAGADAVYLGVEQFNMRQGTANFKLRALPKIVAECHARGVKAYLTLNTLIFESELPALKKVLDGVAASGIDAVIAWDPSVMRLAHERGIPLFASTQCSIANTEAMLSYNQAFGIKRFVLARECPLVEIKRMQRTLRKLGKDDFEIEVFAHGAMCVSISGRCYLSTFMDGQSANRGTCTQPCRREYQITDDTRDKSLKVGPQYILSPQDLCTLPFLEKILDAGVTSLKIEGRNRPPDYVYRVTRAYRRVVDAYQQRPKLTAEAFTAVKAGEMHQLENVYHRGLSSGFYHGVPLDQWATSKGNHSTSRKVLVGRVLNYYPKAGVAHMRVLNSGLHPGRPLMIQGPTTGHVELTCPVLYLEKENINCAQIGQEITLAVPAKVRRNDQVYLEVQTS